MSPALLGSPLLQKDIGSAGAPTLGAGLSLAYSLATLLPPWGSGLNAGAYQAARYGRQYASSGGSEGYV